MGLGPKLNQARELKLKGSVQLKTQADTSGEARTLQTNELRVEFAAGKKGESSKLDRAETLSAGSMEWTDAAVAAGKQGVPADSENARAKLQADKVEKGIGGQGEGQKMTATRQTSTNTAVCLP